MSVQGGPTLKGEWVIVPFSMRPEIKTAIHSSQSGIYSCLKKARECLLARHDWGHGAVYLHLWNLLHIPIRQPTGDATASWTSPMPVGVDLFELDGKEYMITVDHFSNFSEIDTLENIKSSTLIKKMTAHFAQYDQFLALLSYRNTPNQARGTSSVQRFLNQRI